MVATPRGSQNICPGHKNRNKPTGIMAIMWGFHFAWQWREEGSAQQSHVRQHEEGGREREGEGKKSPRGKSILLFL